MDWLKKILTSLLDDWFVPIEDYRYVQARRWSAERQVEEQEKYIARLMDQLYEPYKPLEQFGNSAELDMVRVEDIELRDFIYRFHVRISHWRFYSIRDVKQLMQEVKDVFISNVCNAFREHVSKVFDSIAKETDHASSK